MMYKLRHLINLTLLKNVYYSIVYSHLIYGIEVWGSACQTELKPILTLQKKAMRMMSFNDNFPGPLCPSNPLFKELNILKIDDIFKLHVCKFIFLCLVYDTPSVFHDWYILSSNVHKHSSKASSVVVTASYFDVGNVINIPTLF